jgi:class 3 adenylate cyclase/pimeloyl-ACP methyl ester carboxylesterase
MRDVGERLSSFSRFITFDQRGAGLSDPLPFQALPTLDERMDDVRVVLDAVGSERAVLVGQGHGGPQCMVFAATYPDRVSSLVLYDTYARWLRDEDYPAGMPADVTSAWRDLTRTRWGKGFSIEAFLPSLADDAEMRGSIARLERMGASMSQIEALLMMWTQTDVRDVLSSIKVPTLVMHREHDPQFRVGHGRYLADHIPDATYVELPGKDHFWVGEDLDLIPNTIEEFVTGRPRMMNSDRVLATVLFTDIVDSTGAAAAMGDRAWRATLDRHDATVRRQLERYRGTAVKNTGDGVVATFDGPARAVTCACAIRDAVRGLGIEIRAGMHTGEIERRGDDISGLGVHIAARVAHLASPSEVLVSSTVKDLVVGSGIAFEDHGVHTLKGVPDRWRVLRVMD